MGEPESFRIGIRLMLLLIDMEMGRYLWLILLAACYP